MTNNEVLRMVNYMEESKKMVLKFWEQEGIEPDNGALADILSILYHSFTNQ